MTTKMKMTLQFNGLMTMIQMLKKLKIKKKMTKIALTQLKVMTK